MPALSGVGSALSNKAVRGLFMKAFMATPRKLIWTKLAEPVETFSLTENFANLGAAPQLAEIEFDRESQFSDMREYTTEWNAKEHRAGLRMKRSFADFDQIGQVETLAPQLAANVVNYPDKLMTTFLAEGLSKACILSKGGTFFFSESHSLGGSAPTTQSNIVTGNTPTSLFTGGSTMLDEVARFMQRDIATAITRLLSYKLDNGMPKYQNQIDAKDLVLVCSPLVMPAAKIAAKAAILAHTSNVLGDQVGEVISNNHFESTGATAADWYLAYVGGPRKPMCFNRFQPRGKEWLQDAVAQASVGRSEGMDVIGEQVKSFTALEIVTNFGNPQDSYVMRHGEYLMQARMIASFEGGDPLAIVKVDNAAA